MLGVLPGIIGSLQANEAIKLILGEGDPLIGRLIHFDALSFRFREIKLKRDVECSVCGENPTINSLSDYEMTCETPDSSPLQEIDVHQLKERMALDAPFVLLDVREHAEVEICCLPNATVIPLGELPQRLGELDAEKETIIHCKAGGRSAQALQILNEAGFSYCCHVQGGINAWSQEIDSSVALY